MMTHPLSRIPLVGKFVDERFIEHRRRSSSVAGIITACATVFLFDYRVVHDHVWEWDLGAMAILFLVLKMGLFAWYRAND